tara:strand:+ start:361 stop:2325 length:1965 start_codon:yes stop_codon:yes gene_type:complete
MEGFIRNDQRKVQVTDLRINLFPLSITWDEENITIYTISENQISENKMTNQAIRLHSEGRIKEAEKYYHYCINQRCKDPRVFSNYGILLKDLGRLKEAEKMTRIAIKLNPSYVIAFSNLGSILKDLGRLDEAEKSIRKSIQLNPDYAMAYSNLGSIYKDLGRLYEAEIFTRKAIEIKDDLVIANSNLGSILRDLGKLDEAEIFILKAIQLNPNCAIAHSNLGSILRDLGKLDEAEKSLRKAIYIKSSLAEANSNLGSVLRDLGRLEEAKTFACKAIDINPDLAEAHLILGTIFIILGEFKKAEISIRLAIDISSDFANAYYTLSTFKNTESSNSWQQKLFSDHILNQQTKENLIHIYFARSNVLHQNKKYLESSKYLLLANNLKLELSPSKPDIIIKKSKKLMFEIPKNYINCKKNTFKVPESIFIVGMPRSGSTLLESILSMNKNANDLGEINIFEELYLEWKKFNRGFNLSEFYWERTNINNSKFNITTNKWLYNYQYAGIITKLIPNSKIIHCYRNPLDNILSIYRAHFARGNQYSSSLLDSVKVYLHQDEIMTKYKNKYSSSIYDLNYDELVCNPNKEIKLLISWLGWEWDESYLTPHLNPRSVSTASNIQVRSPINSKSLGGWKNYKDMLKPVIDVFEKHEKYKDLKFS